MTVKKARKLRDNLFFAGLCIILLGAFWKGMYIVGSTVAFSGLILHFLFNRCPHCEKQLGRNEGEFCQFCGKRIEP